mmetsp:Transcript_10191/g.25516  ORF Transcript_10191/g.25516 Transcript_10191/m.25516 type:complete len:113 (-) Transcript_10191:75-413(-)
MASLTPKGSEDAMSTISSGRGGGMARSASQPALVSGNSPVLSNVGSACIYARSNGVYGSQIPRLAPPKFGLSNRFSQKVGDHGMPQNKGLKTAVYDHSRFMRGTLDWTQRIM